MSIFSNVNCCCKCCGWLLLLLLFGICGLPLVAFMLGVVVVEVCDDKETEGDDFMEGDDDDKEDGDDWEFG
jgi:hypothetical protein